MNHRTSKDLPDDLVGSLWEFDGRKIIVEWEIWTGPGDDDFGHGISTRGPIIFVILQIHCKNEITGSLWISIATSKGVYACLFGENGETEEDGFKRLA